MCSTYESVIVDFQSNLNIFVNSVESLAVSTQNLAKIMNHVDPQHSTISKSYLGLLDWSQNLFILAEKFEADFKLQLSSCIDQEIAQPEHCKIRVTMGNIYEKILFFLNHMTHSFVDYSRSESPMSASNFDCHSLASGPPPNSIAMQRLRMLQQQQRRWSEAACTMENNEANIDTNRRWSMPTNVSKTARLNNKPLAGLVSQQQQPQIQLQQNQSTNSEANDGANEWIAIQLLSFRPPIPSRPPSQMQHSSQQMYLTPRSTQQPQQQTRQQRQSRGELNEILILPRNDSLFLGRCQQIAENIRGESDDQ